MASIESYVITQPPNSHKVEEALFSAIQSRNLLPLDAVADSRDIGSSKGAEHFDVKVRYTQHTDSGTMNFLGEVASGDTVHVFLAENPEDPANLTLVKPD